MKRPEHPQPQFERENWQNLNGQWQFETDNSLSGRARGLIEAKSLNNEIIPSILAPKARSRE